MFLKAGGDCATGSGLGSSFFSVDQQNTKEKQKNPI